MFSALFRERGLKYFIFAVLNQFTFSVKVLETDADIVKVFWYSRFIRFCKEFDCFSKVPAGFKFISEMFDIYGIGKPKLNN